MLIDSKMNEKIAEFQDWIKTQPHMPQNIEKLLLLRYLKTFNYDTESAQSLLHYSLEIRSKNRHIFAERDFYSPEIESVFNTCEIVPMLKATPENYKVCILRLQDFSSDKFNFNDIIKGFFMMADLRLVSPDPNPELADGEIPIFDMTGVTIWHLFRINFSTLKLYFKYVQEAHPVRVRHAHVVNCTPLITKIMSWIRPLMKPEVQDRLNFHAPNSETLYDFVPREVLPREYNGHAGSLKEIKEVWVKRLHERREYLKNDSNWIFSDDINNNAEE